MALTLKHQTAAQFVARFRARYRDSEKQVLVKMARFIIAGIQAGDFTDAQCRSAFGLNTSQWNALKTKMQGFIDAQSAVDGAQGE